MNARRRGQRYVAPDPTSRCRWCRERVLWLANDKTGKLAPIDPVPSPDGNIRIDRAGSRYSVVTKEEMGLFEAQVDAAPTLYLNHWVTCASPTAKRLARARQSGHDGPMVTADGDLVHPADRNAQGLVAAGLDPLAPPPAVAHKHHRCSVCGEPVDAQLFAAGITDHPSC